MTLTKVESLGSYHKRHDEPIEELRQMLPDESYFEQICRTEEKSVVIPLLQEHLLQPLQEFTARPSKIIRTALVHAGYDIARSSENQASELKNRSRSHNESDIQICAQIIELLHAGSLMIDDFQDNSQTRRGKPCFHHLYGLPLTVTAGNLLYIWPLRLMMKLSSLSEERIRMLQDCYHGTLEVAHYGQALDISIVIDELPQSDIGPVCQWITRHKTGALTALALEMGAILGGADENLLANLRHFGLEFGSLLQNYDDLGNLFGHREPSKRFEDLILKRPSWIWALIAENYAASDYRKFCESVQILKRDQNHHQLMTWIEEHGFPHLAQTKTRARLEKLKHRIEIEMEPASSEIKKVLLELCERLTHVYAQEFKDRSGHR